VLVVARDREVDQVLGRRGRGEGKDEEEEKRPEESDVHRIIINRIFP
jgi:hypothetical protein